MTIGPEAIPPPEVSQDTVDALFAQANLLIRDAEDRPPAGRTATFEGQFTGEPVGVYVHTKAFRGGEGPQVGVIVYPAGTRGEDASIHYNFTDNDDRLRLKKELPIDYSRFTFDEPEPYFEAPPKPFAAPGEQPNPASMRLYKELLARARQESGHTAWSQRLGVALKTYADIERIEHARFGLDIVHEEEGLELLRILHAGEAGVLKQQAEARQKRTARWLGGPFPDITGFSAN